VPIKTLGAQLFQLISAQLFLHATMAGTRMAAPLLMLREGYSPAAVGLLLAFFGLTQVVLAIPAGRYADRHGLLKPVRLSIMAASLGAVLAVVWPIYPVLCLTALLCGGSAGCAVIALQRHVGRMAAGGAQLRQVFSWLAIGPAVSNVLGPVAVGLLIDHAGPVPGSMLGYQAAFALMAIFPWLTWLLLRRVQEAPNSQPVKTETETGASLRAWDLLKDRCFAKLMLVNWLVSSCWDVHLLIVPLIGVERGMNASAIGAILGGFALAATGIRVLMPLIAERLQEWAVIAGSMLVTTAVFAAYPFMPGAWGMAACSVVLGMALGVVQPMVMSTLHQITPEHRQGEALGLRLMGMNASSVVMPMVFGAAGTVIGISGVFWCVSALVGAGSRSAYLLRVDKKHE
jgi:MFS family permease